MERGPLDDSGSYRVTYTHFKLATVHLQVFPKDQFYVKASIQCTSSNTRLRPAQKKSKNGRTGGVSLRYGRSLLVVNYTNRYYLRSILYNNTKYNITVKTNKQH
jgi:hypothetical protein